MPSPTLHMAGIQISGLVANSSFDWKSIVDQLIAADSIPITNLQTQKTKNTDQITALAAIKTSLTDLQTSVQAIRSNDTFTARNVTSDTPNTTWTSNSANGATVGAYKIAVSQLASPANVTGAGDIGVGLSTTSDVSGTTLANLATATAVSAGTITVNGKPVTIALTDSLQNVFDNIALATGGTLTNGKVTGGSVTGSYDPSTDAIKLTSTAGNLVLGAANDTSNFFAVMKLSNNGGKSASSAAPLGDVKLYSPLVSSGLRGLSALTQPDGNGNTAVDSSGNGTFSVNGVPIAYNINTDSLNTVLYRINQSGAGVAATYDSANDRVLINNKTTGDVGIGLTETGNGLLGAMGVAGTGATFGLSSNAAFNRGNNALFTLNDGPQLASASNTLDSSVTGVTGLSVTVNSKTTETVTVASDTASMTTALQDFMTKFNAVQDLIASDTAISVSGTNVTTAVLSNNREVDSWASQLQSLAFDAVSGIGGTVQRLDNLGIDFDGITGHLILKNPDQLASALANHPDDARAFFMTPTTGMVSKMFTFLTNTGITDSAQQDIITKASSDIDTQITALQTRLDAERTSLTNSFMAMLDAQSTANTQSTYLTSTFFNNNSNNNNSCWVARAVYGARNPRWLVFRFWLLHRAPAWFRALYLRHGERFAGWLADKPWLQAVIRRWMDARIAGLVPVFPSS